VFATIILQSNILLCWCEFIGKTS